jgi:hypothetical protein
VHYTDIDRVILARWTEVIALRRAFDELIGRMKDAVGAGVAKAERWAADRGYLVRSNVKEPSLDIWKPEWNGKRNGEPAIYFTIAGFAPVEYGRDDADQPWLWLNTEGLSKFKMNESDRMQFARALRFALGPELAARWDNPDVVDVSEPLGRYCREVTEAERVRWMSNPEELAAFITKSVDEVMTLAPAIDQQWGALRK